MKAALILADGTVFEGRSFAASGRAVGHAVAYTGVVGYQEVLTCPSYRGGVVAFTYPIIGTYGVNPDDSESPRAQAAGVVLRDYTAGYSNWRATGELEEYLATQGVVGVRGVDTRALAVHLRERGEMSAMIVSGDFDPGEAVRTLHDGPPPLEADLFAGMAGNAALRPVGTPRCRAAVLDLGARKSLLEQLAVLGCEAEMLPAGSKAERVLADAPGRLVVAGGPGDPRRVTGAAAVLRELLGKLPVLGIGLGHQVLALALGGRVEPMKLGHHGVNQPVRELASGRCRITEQHHSFVVSDQGLPAGAEVTHRNVNDGTVEGIASRPARARSIQYHPMPDEEGRPDALLADFLGDDHAQA